MPQISKQKIPEKILLAISDQLISELARRKGTETKHFFENVFTETERIMFAKRFAIIIMLHQGFQWETIQETLKVSPSTVNRLWREYKEGNFDALLTTIHRSKKKHESQKTILDFIETIVQAGMPVQGRGRWKGVLGERAVPKKHLL